MAAHLTRGVHWYDQSTCAPADVLLVVRDNADPRPQLESLGATMDKVHVLALAQPLDDAALQNLTAELERHPNTRLVIIDPFDAPTALLAPLATLARQFNLTLALATASPPPANHQPPLTAFHVNADNIWIWTLDA